MVWHAIVAWDFCNVACYEFFLASDSVGAGRILIDLIWGDVGHCEYFADLTIAGSWLALAAAGEGGYVGHFGAYLW